MGDEFGQWREWNHDTGLDRHLLDYPMHQGLRRWLRGLGGSGVENGGEEAEPVPAQERLFSVSLTLPPLDIMIFAAPADQERNNG